MNVFVLARYCVVVFYKKFCRKKTLKDRRKNFLRRTTKAPTVARSTTIEPETSTELPETPNPTRRGISKFKAPTRKQYNKKITEATEEISKNSENRGKNDTRPSLSGNSPKRNERRPFVRRRFGAANATTSAPTTTLAPTTSVVSSTISTSSSRRPFRVGSRRRLVSSTAAPTTVDVDDDDDDTDPIEEEPPKPRPTKKTVKIQKRPLLALKNQDIDNHPSATNEELKEGQRESKKYSSSFRQNQLDDALKSEDSTTESRATSIDLDAETAVAIATHQLLSAPLPISNNYDYKTTNKPTYDTTYNNIQTVKTTRAPTTTANSPTVNSPTGFSIQSYSTNLPSTVFYSTTQSPFSTPNDGYSTLRNPGFSSPTLFSQPAGFTRSNYPLSSTARYLGVNQKYVSVPIEEEFGYATESYSGISHEPTYFTREYLLESPVTRTYDDEYQYLSTLTTQEPKTTTEKRVLPKKFATRKSPTPITQRYSQTTARSRTPKPYEKIVPVKKVYKPIENYDYYDDSHEKLAGKYSEDTKVVVNDRGGIQCLDIGNFPHPVSCKKFIQCARMESGQIRGWEYVCPKGLSFDPVGGICNWSAGLGCSEK